MSAIDREVRHFWVDIGYGTFYLGAKNGVVIEAAPIANWMINKTLEEIKPWLVKREASVVEFFI